MVAIENNLGSLYGVEMESGRNYHMSVLALFGMFRSGTFVLNGE